MFKDLVKQNKSVVPDSRCFSVTHIACRYKRITSNITTCQIARLNSSMASFIWLEFLLLHLLILSMIVFKHYNHKSAGGSRPRSYLLLLDEPMVFSPHLYTLNGNIGVWLELAAFIVLLIIFIPEANKSSMYSWMKMENNFEPFLPLIVIGNVGSLVNEME